MSVRVNPPSGSPPSGEEEPQHPARKEPDAVDVSGKDGAAQGKEPGGKLGERLGKVIKGKG